MRRVIPWACLSVFLGGVAGCRSQKLDAQATARAYYRALASGRGGRAYSLLDPALQKQIPRRLFLKNTKGLTARQRTEYERAAHSKTMTVSSVLKVRIDDSRTMVWEKKATGWKLTTNLFDFYPQGNPRQALRSFLDALTRGRYHVLLRFVPRQYRKHMSDRDVQAMFQGEQGKRIRRLITILRAHLDAPIEVRDDEATLVYGDSAKVTLVREEGVWRIRDIQ